MVPSSDAAGSGALVAAVSWIEATLLGTIAITIAVIAVASVGLMMMAGRVNVRRGVTVIAGSFVVFGAASIAAGLQSLATGQTARSPDPLPAYVPPPVAVPPADPVPVSDDPYAGAAIPSAGE